MYVYVGFMYVLCSLIISYIANIQYITTLLCIHVGQKQ